MVKHSQTVVKERKIWKLNDIYFFFFGPPPGSQYKFGLSENSYELEWPNGYIMVQWINNCKSAEILNFTSFLLRLFQSLHGSSLFAHTEPHSSAEEEKYSSATPTLRLIQIIFGANLLKLFAFSLQYPVLSPPDGFPRI